jgi:hypothetical protein
MGMSQSKSQEYIKITLTPRFNLAKDHNTSLVELTLGFTNSFLDTTSGLLQPNLYIRKILLNPFGDYTRVNAYIEKTVFLEDESIVPFQVSYYSKNFYNVGQEGIEI